MKMQTVVLAVIALTAGGAAHAQNSGDADAGRMIARDSCATCHAVFRDGKPSPNVQAPPFESIAAVPGMTAIALRAALTSPHHRMPNIVLSPTEMADVIAYILSLKR